MSSKMSSYWPVLTEMNYIYDTKKEDYLNIYWPVGAIYIYIYIFFFFDNVGYLSKEDFSNNIVPWLFEKLILQSLLYQMIFKCLLKS